MKLAPLVVSSVLASTCLVGCPGPADEADRATPITTASAEIDFGALAGREMPIEEFLRACQATSGFNFTYGADTAEAMKSAAVHVPPVARIEVAAFGSWLDARLAPAGFACRRVGPDHLNVLLVERRAG